MKKLFLLATLVFGMNTFAQTIEQKAENVGIELVNGGLSAKQTITEETSALGVKFIYTFEVRYDIQDEKLSLKSVVNTHSTGTLIEVGKYRGVFVDNITKKQYDKIISSLNNKIQTTIQNF